MEKEPVKIRLTTAFLLLLITILICGLVGFYFYHTATVDNLKGPNTNTTQTSQSTPTAKPTATATPKASATPDSTSTAEPTTEPTTDNTASTEGEISKEQLIRQALIDNFEFSDKKYDNQKVLEFKIDSIEIVDSNEAKRLGYSENDILARATLRWKIENIDNVVLAGGESIKKDGDWLVHNKAFVVFQNGKISIGTSF